MIARFRCRFSDSLLSLLLWEAPKSAPTTEVELPACERPVTYRSLQKVQAGRRLLRLFRERGYTFPMVTDVCVTWSVTSAQAHPLKLSDLLNQLAGTFPSIERLYADCQVSDKAEVPFLQPGGDAAAPQQCALAGLRHIVFDATSCSWKKLPANLPDLPRSVEVRGVCLLHRRAT